MLLCRLIRLGGIMTDMGGKKVSVGKAARRSAVGSKKRSAL